jgi:hypothetical protein
MIINCIFFGILFHAMENKQGIPKLTMYDFQSVVEMAWRLALCNRKQIK